jgi:hypothetical protein
LRYRLRALRLARVFKHAIEGIDLAPISNSWLYHGPRLALQPVIIWWALYCAGVIDWPWRRRR